MYFSYSSIREKYVLRHSNVISGYGLLRVRLADDQQTAVMKGDLIGFYFPDENAIPYRVKECYNTGDQLRYMTNQRARPLVGHTYDFQIASFAWDPCREYAIQAIISKIKAYCHITINIETLFC